VQSSALQVGIFYLSIDITTKNIGGTLAMQKFHLQTTYRFNAAIPIQSIALNI